MVNRLFHWNCDFCTVEVLLQPYGLPKKWNVIDADLNKKTKLRHACDKCSKTEEIKQILKEQERRKAQFKIK